MLKTKLYWDNQDDVPEEISLSAIWGICLVFSLIITAIIFTMKLLGFIEKFDPILIFVSIFIFSGFLGSYIRWKSMDERRHKKG